MKKQLKH